MPNFRFHTTPTHSVARRLIYDSKKLSESILKQQSDERVLSRVQEQKRLPEGDVVGDTPCCKAIHIILGFDGTNNNNKADDSSVSPSCSNVTGLVHTGIESNDDIDSRGIFKYYCPGVGTVFPDIKEFTPSNMGLIGAEGGENRIDWGLVQLVDALSCILLKGRLKLNEAQGLVEEISASWTVNTLTGGLLENGEKKRRVALKPRLKGLGEKFRQRQNSGQKSHILAMRLYVYGFSRGAVEARAFSNQLQELTRISDADGRVEYHFAGLPISIEFLSPLDTVAAAGLTDSALFAAGRMDWADDITHLPDEALSQYLLTILPGDCSFLRCYVHLVSCHEQRASFPLDSIRRRDMDANERRTGSSCYRKWTMEYAYLGVHSDVGSGCGVGDQGKVVGGSESPLPQITLWYIYAEALEAGTPLQAPAPAVYPNFHEDWWVMVPKIEAEFSVSEELATRLNA